MTDLFINGIGWVDVPDEAPKWPLRTFEKWTDRDDRILQAMLPRYSLERIAGALDRSAEAVRRHISKKGLAA